ncbi:MAG TPA: hypothetical protein VFA97_04130 [Gaiellaceae bacterium]|nr:hypothetical protein [Gaiellaceae bacterium]
MTVAVEDARHVTRDPGSLSLLGGSAPRRRRRAGWPGRIWGLRRRPQGERPRHRHAHEQFDHGFNAHIALGYLIFLGSIVLLLLALLGRLRKPLVLQSLGVVLLVLLAIVLAVVGGDHPIVGFLHPIDAFAVVGLVARVAHGQRAGRVVRER